MLGLQYPAAMDLDIDLTVLSDSRIESPLSWLMYFHVDLFAIQSFCPCFIKKCHYYNIIYIYIYK